MKTQGWGDRTGGVEGARLHARGQRHELRGGHGRERVGRVQRLGRACPRANQPTNHASTQSINLFNASGRAELPIISPANVMRAGVF